MCWRGEENCETKPIADTLFLAAGDQIFDRSNLRTRFSHRVSLLPSSLKGIARKPPMFERVLIAARRTRSAPPCIRHRFFPFTAGDMQGLPERVLAPQRWLFNIGAVLQG
jgi:hypothetical protein